MVPHAVDVSCDVYMYMHAGKSDPYCRIGIINEEHLESHLVKHKDMMVWKREGWMGEVKTTSIKLATLDPDWNEEFELYASQFYI